MSRYSSSGSYDHKCVFHSAGTYWGEYYRISWTVDHYYEGSRLRFPRTFSRDTDEKGAKRFCKKWNLSFEREGK